MQRYTYLRLMELNHYKTIFIADFDSEMLIKVMETFKTQVIDNPAFNNETEQEFIADFLLIVASTPNFDFSLEFLGKKEKEMIAGVLTRLTLASVEKVTDLLVKFRQV